MKGGCPITTDSFFMELALKEAQKALQRNEVPVGAVVVCGDELIVCAGNLREREQNLLAHAEILAIQKASKKRNSWRLENCRMYVSLEPCLMCMGAIIQARFTHLFYACSDPKMGFSSYYSLDQRESWKHKIQISSGIKHDQSSILLKDFFKKLRN